MVVLVPGALAFVFGWFAFRSRVTGVYLSIITQAMTYALLLGFLGGLFLIGSFVNERLPFVTKRRRTPGY